MIVNLAKSRFLQQLHTIDLINQDGFGILFAAYGKPPPEMHSHDSILPSNCLQCQN